MASIEPTADELALKPPVRYQRENASTHSAFGYVPIDDAGDPPDTSFPEPEPQPKLPATIDPEEALSTYLTNPPPGYSPMASFEQAYLDEEEATDASLRKPDKSMRTLPPRTAGVRSRTARLDRIQTQQTQVSTG